MKPWAHDKKMKRHVFTYMVETCDGNMIFIQAYNKDMIKHYFNEVETHYSFDEVVSIERVTIYNLCETLKA